MLSSIGPTGVLIGFAPNCTARLNAAGASLTRNAIAHADGPCSRAKFCATLCGSALMMKLISPCACSVTFLLRCRARAGNPSFANKVRSSSGSGAVYSTNSNPSVPMGLSARVAKFCVADCVMCHPSLTGHTSGAKVARSCQSRHRCVSAFDSYDDESFTLYGRSRAIIRSQRGLGPANMHAVKRTDQPSDRPTDRATDPGAGSVKKVAEFSIPYFQFLDASGSPLAPLPPCAANHAELVKMYRTMVLARAFDVKAVNLQRIGKLGTYPPAVGHEAVQVACGAALREEDCIAPVYREIATQMWRGVRMTDILLYWGGDERGNDFAKAKHDFPWCVPISTQTLHAAGAALAYKIRHEPRIAMAFIGDGGTSEGTFYEAINVAGVQKLPMVMIVINNQWAISVPLSEQTATQTLAQKAIAAGVPGVQIDGNDVLAAREVIGAAVDRARAGEGPTVIEAITYRLGDHTTADDATRYRRADDVKEAWAREPIKRTRALLERSQLWNEQQEEALKKECAQQVEAAVQEFLATPKPSTDAMFDYLFANPPKNLAPQKEMAKRFGGSGH